MSVRTFCVVFVVVFLSVVVLFSMSCACASHDCCMHRRPLLILDNHHQPACKSVDDALAHQHPTRVFITHNFHFQFFFFRVFLFCDECKRRRAPPIHDQPASFSSLCMLFLFGFAVLLSFDIFDSIEQNET